MRAKRSNTKVMGKKSDVVFVIFLLLSFHFFSLTNDEKLNAG